MHDHNNPPLVTVLRHMNPVSAFPSYLLKLQFSTILPFTTRSSKWLSFLQVFPPKLCMHFLFNPTHTTCLTHLTLIHSITLIIFGDLYKPRSLSLCNFHQLPVTFFLLWPKIFLGIPILNTVSQYSSLNVRDQVDGKMEKQKILNKIVASLP